MAHEPRREREGGGGGRDRGRGGDREPSEFIDKLVHINRVAKVVKGGRRFGFAALVVVGDQKGRVGFGHGKAREVPEAIRKATEAAKRNLVKVPLREGRTLHHDVTGQHGAGRVILRAAPAGVQLPQGRELGVHAEVPRQRLAQAADEGLRLVRFHGVTPTRAARARGGVHRRPVGGT